MHCFSGVETFSKSIKSPSDVFFLLKCPWAGWVLTPLELGSSCMWQPIRWSMFTHSWGANKQPSFHLWTRQNEQDHVPPLSSETAAVVLYRFKLEQNQPWCQGNERRRPRGSESGTVIRGPHTPTEPGWWVSHSQTGSLSGSGTSPLHSRSEKRSKHF